MPTRADLTALVAKLHAPARARLSEARAAVAHCETPDEAWEGLIAAGLLPEAWSDDPERRFAAFAHEPCPHAHPRGALDRCARCGVPALLARSRAAPPAVGLCALVAADVPGMLAAEALARELLARLPDAPRPTRVVWVAHDPSWCSPDPCFAPWLAPTAPAVESEAYAFAPTGPTRRSGVDERSPPMVRIRRRADDVDRPHHRPESPDGPPTAPQSRWQADGARAPPELPRRRRRPVPDGHAHPADASAARPRRGCRPRGISGGARAPSACHRD